MGINADISVYQPVSYKPINLELNKLFHHLNIQDSPKPKPISW